MSTVNSVPDKHGFGIPYGGSMASVGLYCLLPAVSALMQTTFPRCFQSGNKLVKTFISHLKSQHIPPYPPSD